MGNNSVSTQKQLCHQLFLFTRDSTFLFGICTCIWHQMLAKYDQGHPQTAIISTEVIGGWGMYRLIIAPRAFHIQKLESRIRIPDNIDK